MSFRLWMVAGVTIVGAAAATAPIGMLTTVGAVRMDNLEVRGNGTVVDGSVIETLKNPSQLNLKNGTRFELSPNSRAKVFDNRVLLEKGSSQVHGPAVYAVEIDSIRVTPSGTNATVQVVKIGPKSIEVAAVTGQAEVRNGQGLLIARVVPGSPLDLMQQPEGATGPSRVSGKLTKSGGHYLLKDTITNTTVELQGNDLDGSVGHCVALTGSADPSATAVAGATQIIHVSDLKTISCGKKAAAAAVGGGAAGGAAAAGAATGGLSAAAIGGIVAGAATAATLGGLAAAGEFTSARAATASAH